VRIAPGRRAGEARDQGGAGLLAQEPGKTETGLLSTLNNDLTFETDAVMFATGRDPYVEGLGLEKAGVKLNDRGAIVVDEHSKTTADNIWAVGDVTDRINLTPVAIREGAAFAQTEFYDNPTTLRSRHGRLGGVLAAAGRGGGHDRGRRRARRSARSTSIAPCSGR
jgi:pyruvate/2-oxoglutarate dehydrogenase complex dihydrolipoamide dehydrogenase (E3) component